MVKFFFPASGVGFSELCRIVMTFCHISVSRIFEQIQQKFVGGDSRTIGPFWKIFLVRQALFGHEPPVRLDPDGRDFVETLLKRFYFPALTYICKCTKLPSSHRGRDQMQPAL